MKSVMITFDQAFYERIIKTLDRLNCRGFSYFQQVKNECEFSFIFCNKTSPLNMWVTLQTPIQ